MHIDIDRDRLIETMEDQATIGGTEGGGLNRLALSDADREVRDWFVECAIDAGLDARVDAFGNIFARREGVDPDAEPVLVGSHLDSQPYGGIYDGALGVVAALEFIRTLNDQAVETRRPIEVVNWTNEEGSRFPPAMQGSGVWAGAHDIETEYEKTDTDGNRLLDELERIGYRGDEPAEPREPYHAYLELHPEQGPFLEETGADVGIVTGIVGLRWAEITLRGQANHTGTTPMAYREDALVAASDIVTAIRRLPGTLGNRTVATVGSLTVQPNSVNIVPETVTFTTDIRDPDAAVLDEAVARVEAEVAAAADREGVEHEIEHTMASPTVDFPDRPVEAVADATEHLGYDGHRMVSGAGHDATHAAAICDAAMVFSVSEDGKSHTEDEFTSWTDCYRSSNVLANAALDLAKPIVD
jgi:N-carbamoyl-L-amino-acid hydrolase